MPASFPAIIAHRGGAGAPDNSLVGLKTAIRQGAQGMEFDVVAGADNEPLLYHDRSLNARHTSRRDGQRVWAWPLRALSPDMRAQYQLHGEGDPEPLITLAQFLRAVSETAPPDFRLMPEFKTPLHTPRLEGGAMIAKTIALLEQWRLDTRTCFLSFDWRALAYARALAPHIPIACTTMAFALTDPAAPTPTPTIWRRLALSGAPWWQPVRFDPTIASHHEQVLGAMARLGAKAWCAPHKDVTKTTKAVAQKYGLDIYSWTPNEKADWHRLATLGVEALITDRPDAARPKAR